MILITLSVQIGMICSFSSNLFQSQCLWLAFPPLLYPPKVIRNHHQQLYLLMPSVLGMNVYNKLLSVIRISQVSTVRLPAFFNRLRIFNTTFHYSWQWVELVPSASIYIAEQSLFLRTPFVASQFRPNQISPDLIKIPAVQETFCGVHPTYPAEIHVCESVYGGGGGDALVGYSFWVLPLNKNHTGSSQTWYPNTEIPQQFFILGFYKDDKKNS